MIPARRSRQATAIAPLPAESFGHVDDIAIIVFWDQDDFSWLIEFRRNLENRRTYRTSWLEKAVARLLILQSTHEAAVAWGNGTVEAYWAFKRSGGVA